MTELVRLETRRLILRPWREEDRAPFAALNADPRVTAHLTGVLGRAESDAIVDRVLAGFAEHGHGPWALEVKGGAPFIGFCGIWNPSFTAHFMPCTEIGWRLAHEAWGKGYATESAEAALAYGFGALRLAEIVAYTTPANRRSRGVMERLGMRHDPADDFERPPLTDGAPARTHVLYRLRREDWAARRSLPGGAEQR
jgi:ribosomal-protein-alanine N-acetyltransferase